MEQVLENHPDSCHTLPHCPCQLLHLLQGGLHLVQHGDTPLLLHQVTIFLRCDCCEVSKGPDSPELALRSVAHPHQVDDGGEGPVVDVPP